MICYKEGNLMEALYTPACISILLFYREGFLGFLFFPIRNRALRLLNNPNLLLPSNWPERSGNGTKWLLYIGHVN
ncbi:hypothetical protein V6N13_022008 [Hibiscus sabdariffa]|uniref:Uncharacterized protein n=1 Tax=Hibiscus sabdariffa TaxID=183260 RepID=A0ABR2CQV7_9ROSI